MRTKRAKAVALLMALLFVTASIVYQMPATSVYASEKVNVTATHPSMNTIKLSWDKVNGATGYDVYYAATQNGTYERISSVKDTVMIFDDLKTDTYYYFKVIAYKSQGGAHVEVASSDTLSIRSNRIGIDVSKWNGLIDWKKVKQAGIEFAMVRVAYGLSTTAENYTDSSGKKYEDMYKRNIQGAIDAGIPVGVYIYSTATTTAKAKEEANYVLKLIKDYKIDYPVVFDIEKDSYHENLSKTANTNLVKAFMQVIEAAGYDVILYTGCSFSQDSLNMDSLKMYDWWIPHYGNPSSDKNGYYPYAGKYHFRSLANSNPCYSQTYMRLWQYTERGKVNGITGYVDMNYELDLKESMWGSTYVDLKTMEERYVAGENETVSSIASKLGISTATIVERNWGYASDSKVAAGKSLAISTLALTAPSVTLSMESSTSIKVSFDSVSLADGYEIYYATSEKGTYKKLTSTTDTSYVHKGVSASATHYYKVAAYQTVDGVKEWKESEIVSMKLSVAAPTNVTAASTGYNKNKISWNGVAGAAGYKVYASTSKTGTYKLIKTTTALSYTHKNLTHRQRLYYKVKAYVKGSTGDLNSSYSSRVTAKPVQPAASNVYVSKASSTSITLSYTKSSGAAYYKIYRATSKNGTYKKVAQISTTTYTDKKVAKNTTYYYKVRAYRTLDGKTYASDYSHIIEAIPGTVGPKTLTVEAYSRRVYLTWSAVTNATGYEIYRSTEPDGTYKLVTSKSARYVNNTGLAGETTYYYKVRSYSLVNKKKVFSNYSKIISVKTLK